MTSQLLTIARQPARKNAEPPCVVMILPRGEALRNFVYSDTLAALSEQSRVVVLSVVTGPLLDRFRGKTERILELHDYPPRRLLSLLRGGIDLAHFKWLGSEVARETLRRRVAEAPNLRAAIKRKITGHLAGILANRPCLRMLDALEKTASWKLRSTETFVRLFSDLKPDIVFNGSHIHGPAADEPLHAAHHLGIPTAGFIFSWDNLTSRGRILAPYDYFLVWNRQMKEQLLRLYPHLGPDRVFVTGTPQMDFHFKEQFRISRAELCSQIGADPHRPIILYTAGMNTHFPEEHRTVAFVAEAIGRMNVSPKPQLVVRTYKKGTSEEMKRLAASKLPHALFPEVLWEEKWKTPLYEDLAIYGAMLREAALGINAASTVSLELIIHDKPVINLGFDPPGSKLGPLWHYERHLRFDHYAPVVASGAVMVARSQEDLEAKIRRALSNPGELHDERLRFRRQMFGSTLDGNCGLRVATKLIELARDESSVRTH